MKKVLMWLLAVTFCLSVLMTTTSLAAAVSKPEAEQDGIKAVLTTDKDV